MELGSIIQFFENKTILVTGATGFLAKIFVEKILRTQPDIKKLYLLLRASDANSAVKRLQEEIIGKELFKVLREKHRENFYSFVSDKIIPIAGDISDENLGVQNIDLRDELVEEVDFVLNFAATTKFHERYDVALGINTLGALNVLNFAKKCHKIQMLVHVSTAYVCGEDKGTILEKQFAMGKAKKGTDNIVIEAEKKLVEEKLQQLQSENASEKAVAAALKDLGLQRARHYGWPNTYVLTKSMGEMLLVHSKQNLPLIIIRPTMILSTFKEPFPGWIEGIKTIDSVIVGYGTGKVSCFIDNPRTIMDMIPADMVVNCIILEMVGRGRDQSTEIVYQIGSSLRNPITTSEIRDYTYSYFSANPWINKDGSPSKIGKCMLFSSMRVFHAYMAICYQLPLKALQVASTLVLKNYKDTYTSLDRRVKLLMRFIELYKPYALFEGIFDDSNSEKLRKAARETSPKDEANIFECDPTLLNWDDYLTSIHIPGLIKYSMK